MDIDSYKKKIGSLAAMAKKAPGKLNELAHGEKKSADVGEPSSEAATFEEKRDLSIYADSETPWIRRWYMFAFVYPTIVSIILGIFMGVIRY